jgi:hypothetical protein
MGCHRPPEKYGYAAVNRLRFLQTIPCLLGVASIKYQSKIRVESDIELEYYG